MRPLWLIVLLGCGQREAPLLPTTTLGAFDHGILAARPVTEALAVDLGEGALSLTLLAESDSTATLALDVEAPGGERIIRADNPAASANPSTTGPHVVVAQIPLVPEVELVAGRYLVRLLSSAEGADVRVRSFVKYPNDAAVDVDRKGQLFRIAVLFATSLLRPGDSLVARAVSRAEDILSAVPLALEDIWEHELDEAGTIDYEGEEFDRLLEQSAGLADSAIPVFVVDDIRAGDTSVPALSAGIPLPPVAGTVRSGILLSASSMVASPEVAGEFLAHEIGHALGLFHTTEREGAPHDPLADTPECDVANDTNGDGELFPGECEGAGADNVMFWACCGATFSDDQRYVMLRAALTR